MHLHSFLDIFNLEFLSGHLSNQDLIWGFSYLIDAITIISIFYWWKRVQFSSTRWLLVWFLNLPILLRENNTSMFRQVSVISRQRCCAPKRNRTLVIVLTNIALNTITNPVGDFLIQSLKPSSGITNLEQNSIWCTSSLSYLEALFREHSVRWGRRYHCMPDLQFDWFGFSNSVTIFKQWHSWLESKQVKSETSHTGIYHSPYSIRRCITIT